PRRTLCRSYFTIIISIAGGFAAGVLISCNFNNLFQRRISNPFSSKINQGLSKLAICPKISITLDSFPILSSPTTPSFYSLFHCISLSARRNDFPIIIVKQTSIFPRSGDDLHLDLSRRKTSLAASVQSALAVQDGMPK